MKSAYSLSELSIERFGFEGPPILLLHGWGRSLENLKGLGQLLSHRLQVHLIDLPGFGKSPAPEGVWSALDYADCLCDYLDSLGLERVDILGHSFGGKVAMSMALRYPSRVGKLILIAANGLKRKRSFLQKMRISSIRYLSKGCKTIDALLKTQLFQKRFVPRFGSSDYRNANAKMRSILVKSVNEDMSKEVKEIQASTLLIWGSLDTETPPEIAERLHRSISKSEMIIFPGKDHYLHEDAGAQLCAYYIEPFLERKRDE
jgi:pimeloyl-ACP methyl ester carboxylesterase